MSEKFKQEPERLLRGPLLCPPEEKARREVANGVQQMDYLSYLVTQLQISEVRESHILELQRLTVDGIYPCGGTYRDARTRIHISSSEHVPPESAFVSSHVQEMLAWINDRSRPALERAAFALWRLNWIHPFCGGNGRTSRCVAYLVLCIDMGLMMPGVPTLPNLIYDRREEYVAALQKADASARTSMDQDSALMGSEALDLSTMSTFLKDLVIQQLASAVAKLSGQAQH